MPQPPSAASVNSTQVRATCEESPQIGGMQLDVRARSDLQERAQKQTPTRTAKHHGIDSHDD
jgi:hypothetical protein